MTIREARYCDLCNKPIKSHSVMSRENPGTVEVGWIYESYNGVDLHPDCYCRVKSLLKALNIPKFKPVAETQEVDFG